MLRKAFYIAVLEIKQFAVPGTLIYLFLMPLLFTFAIGQASVEPSDKSTPEQIHVAVVNQDTGKLGEYLIKQIEIDSNLAVQTAAKEAAITQVDNSELQAALIIPAHFSDTLLAGETVTLEFYVSGSSERTQLVEQAMNAAASRLIGSLHTSKIVTRVATNFGILHASDSAGQQRYEDAAFEHVDLLWSAALPIDLQATQVTRYEQEDIPTGLNQSSPGMLVMFSMFAFLGGGVMLVAERQIGTLPRLIMMPVSKVSIMLGKLAGIFVIGVVQIVILILAGILLFDVRWGQSPAALTLVVLSLALAATCLGLLLAALVRTAAQASALDNIIVLSFSALGGAWWPLEIVPKWMQTLAHALPTAWAMDAFHDIITRGLGVEAVLPEVGALLLFAAVFFTIAIWRFRYE